MVGNKSHCKVYFSEFVELACNHTDIVVMSQFYGEVLTYDIHIITTGQSWWASMVDIIFQQDIWLGFNVSYSSFQENWLSYPSINSLIYFGISVPIGWVYGILHCIHVHSIEQDYHRISKLCYGHIRNCPDKSTCIYVKAKWYINYHAHSQSWEWNSSLFFIGSTFLDVHIVIN